MRATRLALTALLALALGGCAASAPAAPPGGTEPPSGPSGSANMHVGASACPASVDLATTPDRVVTLDGSAAAFLIALGLGDRIVGTAGVDFIGDFTGELRAQLDAIPVIDEAQGNQEAVLSAEPDLVTGISAYEFGGFDGSATVETLAENGIAALAACGAQTDGENTSLDAMYTYIAQLGGAFGVEEDAEALIDDLSSRVAAVSTPDGEPVPTLILMATPDEGTGIRTRGGTSYANALVSLAGGRSLAAGMVGDSVEISAEEVARADPRVIVAVAGFGRQSREELEDAIASSPHLESTTAVQNGAIVVLTQRMLLSPNLLNVDAIEEMAAVIDAAR